MLIPKPADGSVTERARRSIYLLLPAGRATLDQVADNLALHPRTLQRLLEQEKRTFATLLGDARRELALRYLSNSTHSGGGDRPDDRLFEPQRLHPLVRRRVRRGAGGVAGGGAAGGWRRGVNLTTPTLAIAFSTPSGAGRGSFISFRSPEGEKPRLNFCAGSIRNTLISRGKTLLCFSKPGFFSREGAKTRKRAIGSDSRERSTVRKSGATAARGANLRRPAQTKSYIESRSCALQRARLTHTLHEA